MIYLIKTALEAFSEKFSLSLPYKNCFSKFHKTLELNIEAGTSLKENNTRDSR